MKKIILHKKRRDEVNAASGGFREIPFGGHSQEVCLEENRNSLKPSDECFQNEMPSSEEPGTRTPPIEQSKPGMSWIGSPSSDQSRTETQSRSEILKVSSLMSGTTLPLPADPVTMVAPRRERELGVGRDRYYLDDTGSEASGLPSYLFPRYYPFGASQLQNVNPAMVLQHGRLIDEAYLTGVSVAATSASTPARYCDERAILPFHSKPEHKGYMEQYGFNQTNFSLRRPSGNLLGEAALVSSSDVVDKRTSHYVKTVDDDIDDENMSVRKSRSNVLDDALSYDLPKMIDRGSNRMSASPLSLSDSYNYPKQDNVRTSSDDTFKSPSVEAHKTVGRPKGRPAKTALTVGDAGPGGGRSIIRCPVCGKLFNNSSALAKHKLTHSDERKYVCTLCSKAFKRQDHLNGHLMTHSSTKPFGCKFIGCNKSYCDARSLRRHMENHHLECTTVATASGSSSGSCFNFDSSVSQHYGADISADKSGSYLRQASPVNLIIKDGPQLSRPFASFSSDNPQNAMWITGYNPLDEPKPIKCDVCGRGFKNIPALNGHMRLHGGYVRKDLDEVQDMSRGSDARCESRFSLQSESSQSSSGFSAKPSLSASEPSRRCFLSRPSSSEGENLYDRRLNVSNSEPTSGSFYEQLGYFPAVRGDYSNASELQNRNEPGICKSFELDRIKRNSVFDDHHKGKAGFLRLSAQNADLEMRNTVEKRNYSHVVTAINSVNDILNISADCPSSTMKDPPNETRREIQRQKSFEDPSCLDFQGQSKHCKKQKKSTDANDISSVVTRPDSVTNWHSNGAGCQIGSRQSDQAKTSSSCGRWAVGSQVSQQRTINSDEEKLQMSGNDCLPDSTDGKEEIDICRLDSKVTYSDGQPRLQSTDYKSGLPQREIIQGVETDSALRASDACKAFNLTSDQDFAGEVPSAHSEQVGCLYRKRWMNLHLKQAELCCDELPRMSATSVGKQCSDIQRGDRGGNTGCGKPSSPKESSKFVENVLYQPGIKRGGNVDTSRDISSRCLPGSHGTDFVAVRSDPVLPVPLADRAASPPSKRGILGLSSQPDGLHRDVTIQASVPSSPYDLHPPMPCAAHTPYTPFTPVNHPGTPKLASHFEFPPQDCLQESSMCDSPSAAHGSQVWRCHRQLDVCLVVEPEGGRYPTQQRPKRTNTETESKSLYEIHQDEPFYRKATETRDFDSERLVRIASSSDGSNRSNVSTQRNLEMRRLNSGSQGQPLNPRHSLIQTDSWIPDDGMMMAALPTGAGRDCHPEASVAGESDSIDYRKQNKQLERKRKPLGKIKTESECKRPAYGCVTFDAEMSPDAGLQSRQENMKGAKEDDGNLQKKFADHKSGTIFRNSPSPLKVMKVKPRPEPLSIPANVSHFGFPSQMRSSHLWNSLTKPTPTPYTPPPMLSPARSGPGLFWTLQTGYTSPFAVPSALAKYSKSKSGKSWNEDVHSAIEFEKVPPETDTQPHVNIGPQYQPNLPNFYECRPLLRDNSEYDDHSSLLWNPVAIEKLRDEEVKQYMDYSCCAALPGNGVNKEYALHLLHLCQGDMKQAGKLLLAPEPRLPQSSGLTNYKYQECVEWKKAEIELFHQAIMKLDKDFFQIAKLVSTKTVKDCVQFYYLWKKIYPEESKQLKLLRRSHEQSELFVRRSEELRDQTPPIRSCDQSSGGRRSVSSELKKGVKEDSSEPYYQASFSASNSLKEEKIEEFEKRWCSICRRGFASARNFDAHQKKHQQSTSGIESVDFSQALKLPYPALSSVF